MQMQQFGQPPQQLQAGVPPPPPGAPNVPRASLPPVSQLSQRSVHQHTPEEEAAEQLMMQSQRRMRREAASLYPSKDAYDMYVVNHYQDQYDEVYPTYVPPVYTTTTTTTTTAKPYYSPYSSYSRYY